VSTVSLSFSPLPAEVRTARLLAVVLARRSGLPDELLDEVRLAVGEVCSRAVAVHARLHSAEHVEVAMTEDDRGYEITVRDVGDAGAVVSADLEDFVADADADGARDLTGQLPALPAGLDLAVVGGLVDDVTVSAGASGGTVVRLRWQR